MVNRLTQFLAILLIGAFFTVADSQTFNQFPPPGMTYTLPNLLGVNAVTINNTASSTAPWLVTSGGTVNDVLDFGVGASSSSQTGTTQCNSGHTAGKFFENEFSVASSLFTFCTGAQNAGIQLTAFDNTVGNANFFIMFNDTGDGIVFGSTTSTSTNCVTGVVGLVFSPSLTGKGPCTFILGSNSEPTTNVYPIVLASGLGIVNWFGEDDHIFSAIGRTTPVKWLTVDSTGTNQATAVVGDTNASSITNIRGGSFLNTQINGTPAHSGFAATTASIGGALLAAGACTTGTVSVAGATTTMVADATPVTYPGDGNVWLAYVSASGTVTVKICAIVAGTPGASTYNVRVIK